jgi:hypothetical protein
MSEKELISEEGKRRLLLVLKETMQETVKQLDIIRPFINDMTLMGENRKILGLEPSSVEYGLVRLNEYNMLIGFISLDLICAYRVYLKAEDAYEVMYATKHLVVILNEGYKKIYNYVWPNDKGQLNTSGRNKSFWKKDIGNIINEQVPELLPDYTMLTEALDNFLDLELRSTKTSRDMFVHYDDIPSVLYDTLCALDIEVVTQKVIPFLEILKQMMDFTNKLRERYTSFVIATTQKMFTEHYQILENMKTAKSGDPDATNLIIQGQNNLLDMQRQYHANAQNI